MFFVSLTGIAGVIVSKMQFVDRFLSHKDDLMESVNGKPTIGKKQPQLSTSKVLSDNNGFLSEIKKWYSEKSTQRKERKLKKIEQKRIDQMKTMNSDKMIEKEITFESDTATVTPILDVQEDRAKTVAPSSNPTKSIDLDKEETKLINRIALHPQNVTKYRELGDFYIKYGKLDDAKDCFYHILKIDSNDEYAKDKLAQLDIGS